jgi:hypothetical protein
VRTLTLFRAGLQAKATKSFGNLGGNLRRLFYHEEHEEHEVLKKPDMKDRIYRIRRYFPRQFGPARHPVHPVKDVFSSFVLLRVLRGENWLSAWRPRVLATLR